MNWFRVYHDIIDDPKILALSPENRWNFVGLLAISSRQDDRGSLPSNRDIAIHLRITRGKTDRLMHAMVEQGIVDVNPSDGTRRVHGWGSRQFRSDDVSERSRVAMRSSRERSREQPVNVMLAPRARSETETETETETEGGEYSPPPPTVALIGPEYKPVALWAEEVLCDPSICRWVDDQGRIGHPAHWIKAAIEKSLGAGKRDRGYFSGILRGWRRDGDGPSLENAAHANGHAPTKAEVENQIAKAERQAREAGWKG